MPAHLREILTHLCQWRGGCRRRATYVLMNGYNAEVGWFCGTHSDKALREFRAKHEADNG